MYRYGGSMSRFLIGMYGGFDEHKYKRDFRPGFFGVEACLFQEDQDVDKLVRKAREEGFDFGVHYPLIRKDTPYRDPFLLSLDEEERGRAWEQFESEAAYAAGKGAAYILTHFPKPVLVNRSVDLRFWRFAGYKEWMFADEYPYGQLKDNLYALFVKLSDIAVKYGIQVVLENDAMATALTKGDLLTDLLARHDKVKVCLDIGRLHLQEKLDTAFQAMEFAEKTAPYTYLVHLWNTNPSQNQAGGHYPVLPEQKPQDGWADTAAFIRTIKNHNPDVKILYEHRSDLVSDEDLDRCYDWVEALFR